MTGPWLTIVGMSAAGLDSLAPAVQKKVREAEIIVTARRGADELGQHLSAEIHTWPVPFDPMFEQLQGWKGRKVVVIATGDPLWHGVGSIVARRLSPGEFEVFPAPSAFSLAAARLGWPLSSVQTLTLHGYSRPSERIIPFIQPRARLLALTGGNDTVHEVAAHLVRLGFGGSVLHVLEDMETESENHITLTANSISNQTFSAFNTLGVECIAEKTAPVLARIPGLADSAYEHDGQLTKRDVRAASLAALAPMPGHLLWDIGAGCGSIAIEWMRTHISCQAIAFEQNPARCNLIAKNAGALGTPGLTIVEGPAPQSLSQQPRPDAIFIGGGITTEKVFATAWQALADNGRMVCNAVTTQGRCKLFDLQARRGGDLVEISTASLHPLGARQVLKPAYPVLQWRAVKQ